MLRLRSLGFKVITLSQLLDAWDARTELPARTAVVTFDDAYANFAQLAAPILLEHKFPATIFAVSSNVGQYNDWSQQSNAIPRMPLMSVSQLRDAKALGFDIGAHSASHCSLANVSDAQLQHEVVEGKTALEQQLGASVSTFAYPYGIANERVRAVVAQHYRAAVGTRLSLASAGAPRYEMPRVDMYYYRTPLLAKWLGGSAGDLYLQVRAAGRRLRAMGNS